jgi:hypothetical protein
MDGDYACAARIDAGVPLELAPMPVVKGGGLSIANLRRFRSTIRAARPDLLLTYNWGAIEWALANRLAPLCRHVHFEDGFGPDEADGRQLARRVWLRRLALSGRSEIVVPSRLLERIARERWRFAARRVRYIPNGVDCSVASACCLRPQHARASGSRPFGWVGGRASPRRRISAA